MAVMNGPLQKVQLSPHEVMVMLGARDPKLSLKLKSALDAELAKSVYYETIDLLSRAPVYPANRRSLGRRFSTCPSARLG